MAADLYARLPPVERFEKLADPDVYAPVPDDWSVVVADVVGSTEAVAEGRYRDVNYVGAACIAAVLNAADRADLPFVFGGDGATLAVPPGHLGPGLSALAALQEHAAERLGLGLRVGSVPVSAVRAAGHEVSVARYRVSAHYDQALFRGGGVGWAEDQVKGSATGGRWANRAEPSGGDDPYAGLECRWRDVPSPRGETVSLLAEAWGDDRDATYREVLRAVDDAYGEAGHPVALDRLRLALSPSKLSPEARLRHPEKRWRRQLRLWALNAVGRFLIANERVTEETDWGRYPRLFRDATDRQKFDGVLRMVLAGGPEERARLEAALGTMHAGGRLAYGLHVSDRAVLTCLVYHRMGQQVHFVDGAGGGYTRAAVAFKARRRALAASEQSTE